MNKYAGQRGKYADPEGPSSEGYYLRKCQYYYSEYAHDGGGLVNANFAQGSTRRSAKELRDYGRNLQPIEKYLSTIGYKRKEIEKFVKHNISYAPVPIYSKFRNIISSKFTDLNIRASTEAMDEAANLQRMFKKNRMKLTRQEETKAAAPPGTLPKDGVKADTPGEIDYLYGIGEIRLNVEIMAKDALDVTLNKSKWPTINRMVIEDYIDLGGMAVDQYRKGDHILVDYIDIARVIIRPSVYPDFRDSDVRGYVRSRKVSEIHQIDPGIVERHWKELESSYYSGYAANHQQEQHRDTGIREDYARQGQWAGLSNDFGVTEVKFYWLDIEKRFFVKGRHNRGSRIFEEVGPDFNLSERAIRAGKTLEVYNIQRLYTATHILGTDIVYDYGPVEAIMKPSGDDSEVIWPMQVYMAQEPSLTEKVIPFIDDASIAMYKRRDVMSKVPPGPRMIVYKNRIQESVTLGGEKYSVRDLMQMYYREGLLLLDEHEEYTMPGEVASQGRPIDFMPSGILEDIQLAETTIISSLNMIRDATGINEVVDGSASQPDLLKSVVENLKLASNNALRPWLEGYVEFYRNIASSLVWRYQCLAAEGPKNLGMLPMSEGVSRLVRIGPELLDYNMNIKVEVNDSQYFQMLMQMLMQSRDLIPVESYFLIYNALNQGDLRKAEMYLIKYTQLGKEEAHRRQMEIAQATANANAQAAQATEAQRQQSMQMELAMKARLYDAEYKAKDGYSAQEHLRKLEYLKKQKELEKEIALETTEANNANRLTQ